jgi:hypothetical protein
MLLPLCHIFVEDLGHVCWGVSEVIKLVPPAAQNAKEHARADTQRNKQLFDCADGMLRSTGPLSTDAMNKNDRDGHWKNPGAGAPAQ